MEIIKICLTGSIGSGKSSVSKLFREIGIPVFNSDLCAREAYRIPSIGEGIISIIGDDVLTDGKIDRVKFKNILLTNKEVSFKVNQLVIPYIREEFELFCEEHKRFSNIIALESAMVFETNCNLEFNYIVSVVADEETRIIRTMNRDNISREDVMLKINTQLSDKEKIAKSNFIILNQCVDLIDDELLLKIQIETIKKAIYSSHLTVSLKHLISSIDHGRN